MEKLEALTVEKDRIVAERDFLKESCEEMKFTQVGNTSPEFSKISDEPDSGLLENIPPTVKARLIRLEKENQQLKKYKSSSSNVEAETTELQAIYQEMIKQKEEMSVRNRELNMKVMELEASNKDLQTVPSVPRVPGSREELELRLQTQTRRSH